MAGPVSDSETYSDWEEEEVLLYAELDECVDLPACRSAHVIGVDSANPVLQLDDNYFQGKYVPALGTYMFFESDDNAHSSDPLFDRLPEKNLKYVCKTSKVINFSRVYLDPKQAPNDAQEISSGGNRKPADNREETGNTDTPDSKTSKKYQEFEEFNTLEEVLSKFENSLKPPQQNLDNPKTFPLHLAPEPIP